MVMRKIKFYEVWIDIIFRHISSNWYSLLVNGIRQALFKSERGLIQGDPIPPSIFVISAEFLSNKQNTLNSHNYFTHFDMNKTDQIINHPTFVDDVILFFSECRRSPALMMEDLNIYENVSGQLVNKLKSCVSLAPKQHMQEISRLEENTGMTQRFSYQISKISRLCWKDDYNYFL